MKDSPETRYRSVFISDIHLGTRGCKTDYLLDFLRHHESERLYLVGDIIDGWRLRTSWHFWSQAHNDVIQKILRKGRKGTQVYFIPGNHDEMIREYEGMQFGGVSIVNEMVHTTADGRRFLVVHGDEFDNIVRYHKQIAILGSWAYDVALVVNNVYNFFRRKFGYPYWSLSAYLKRKVKNAVEFITEYEHELAQQAKKRGVDGVICGHIHHPEIRQVEGVTYCNDGDWVENCTALVEHFDGRLEIVRWAHVKHREEVSA